MFVKDVRKSLLIINRTRENIVVVVQKLLLGLRRDRNRLIIRGAE